MQLKQLVQIQCKALKSYVYASWYIWHDEVVDPVITELRKSKKAGSKAATERGALKASPARETVELFIRQLRGSVSSTVEQACSNIPP